MPKDSTKVHPDEKAFLAKVKEHYPKQEHADSVNSFLRNYKPVGAPKGIGEGAGEGGINLDSPSPNDTTKEKY